MEVIKRDGRRVPFDKQKIIDAINKAYLQVDGEICKNQTAANIARYVTKQGKDLSVEEIQDIVCNRLMESHRKDVAKAYILYREERTRARGNLTDKTVMELLQGTSEYWNTENSNKDARVVTVQRDYLAGISSTDIARRFLLPKEVREAHDAGIIHQHDMDYMAQLALSNCCLINLEDMLQNGTVINGVRIDPQHRLSTAVTVATQIITAVASSQYGGCTITLTHLAPYLRKSFKEHEAIYIERGFSKGEVAKYAREDTMKEVKDAVQTFNYQINSMSTTNGQAPFISVVMHISEDPEYMEENSILIEEFLKQRIVGLKNEQGVYITPAFPKLLYVLDKENATEDSPYWYLTELAAECTARRMVPDYISAKMMRQLKINHLGQGDVYGCMGK